VVPAGNVATATALAANGTNCTAGQFPLGVDASGAAESCTALPTTIAGTSNEITASASTGAVTLSLPSAVVLTSKTLRVPNSTSLPGTCTVGDSYMDTDATTGARWYLCEATNTWAVQGAAASYNPMDRTVAYLRDEFTPAVQNDGSTIILGQLAWMRQNNPTTAYSTTNLSQSHPGILRVTNSSSAVGAIDLGASSAATLSNPTAYANWEFQFAFRVSAISANNVYRMGLYNAFANNPTDYYGLIFDGSTDTSWKVVMRAASGSTLTADSGVAASTANWFTMRIRSLVTGTVLVSFSTNGGAWSTEKTICASGCDVSGTMPTTTMTPFVYAYNSSGTTSVDMDFFAMNVTGLTR